MSSHVYQLVQSKAVCFEPNLKPAIPKSVISTFVHSLPGCHTVVHICTSYPITVIDPIMICLKIIIFGDDA